MFLANRIRAAANVNSQFVSLDGIDDYISTPDTAALDITGDFDLRCAVALTNWTLGSSQVLIAKFISGESGYLFYVPGGNNLAQLWGTGTQNRLDQSTAIPPATNGLPLLVRGTLDASARTSLFYTKAFNPETVIDDLKDDAGWTQLGDPVTAAGTTVATNNEPLKLGRDAPGGPFTDGDFYGAVVKNGYNGAGSIVAVFDPNDADVGATSVTDSDTGLVWTINGGAVVEK